MARKRYDAQLVRLEAERDKGVQAFERSYAKMRRQLLRMEDARQAVKRLTKRIAKRKDELDGKASGRAAKRASEEEAPLGIPAPGNLAEGLDHDLFPEEGRL